MDLKDILLRKLDSVLNPKLENRIILGFLSLGSILVGVPSILALNAVISVKNEETTFTAEISNGPDITMIVLGAVCLGLAAYFYERKRRQDESHGSNAKYPLVEKDKSTLVAILESINTNVIDLAIERGHHSQYYDPVIHFFYGVQGLAKSSSFIIYDQTLKNSFDRFYQAFSGFVSHSTIFTQTADPDLLRLLKPREVSDYQRISDGEKQYLADLGIFEKAFRDFVDIVKRDYPEIDLVDTNRKAHEDYVRYNCVTEG